MTFKSEHDKKQFITEVVDKVAYCPGFKEELEQLMAKYKIPEQTKMSHNPIDFDRSNQPN